MILAELQKRNAGNFSLDLPNCNTAYVALQQIRPG
jgi:hypothetical protein